MQSKWLRFTVVLVLVFVVSIAAIAQQETETDLEYDPTVCAGSAELETLTDACLEMIAAYPVPPVEDIAQDRFTLSYYSFWRVGPDATPTYDGPGGAVVGSIPTGFNFVNAIDLSVDGWLQIEDGRWIQRDMAQYSEPSYFQGVTLPNGLEHDFAWVLDLSMIFVSEYPGGPASQETGRFLRRYERVNIFDVAVDDEGWRWYMIGPNQWVKQTFVAKASKLSEEDMPEDVSGHWVAVDLYEQTIVAYEDGVPVFATIVATGIPPTETNEGLFEVWARLERDGMSGATGAPNAYALQSVPWVMYFDDGISLHGTYWHDLFGYRQSRGCVNLTISDSNWVYQWMLQAEPEENGDILNYVYVHSSGEYGGNVIRGA